MEITTDAAFVDRLENLLADEELIIRLLTLEKQRRGLATTQLVFIGMHNVAQYWWCAQYAVSKSRINELGFFQAHLFDRIVCAYRLGMLTKLSRRRAGLLDLGRELTLLDAESVWSKQPANWRQLKFLDALASGLEDQKDRFGRGILSEMSRGEDHTTLRWSFPWRKYTVIGVPDGLEPDLVYEFKTTVKSYFLNFTKPVAFAQEDIYGHFFRRSRKRVQIYVAEADRTETYDEPTNIARAEQTLARFAQVESGEPARAPAQWKCSSCEFNEACPTRRS
jgi:hypothetical protein